LCDKDVIDEILPTDEDAIVGFLMKFAMTVNTYWDWHQKLASIKKCFKKEDVVKEKSNFGMGMNNNKNTKKETYTIKEDRLEPLLKKKAEEIGKTNSSAKK
jgi:hypothetical protein